MSSAKDLLALGVGDASVGAGVAETASTCSARCRFTTLSAWTQRMRLAWRR